MDTRARARTRVVDDWAGPQSSWLGASAWYSALWTTSWVNENSPSALVSVEATFSKESVPRTRRCRRMNWSLPLQCSAPEKI
ncbi:MAG TPA: hypothetical protein VIG64_13260 [Actinomycetota bacterium]|jgi:hypothetical protein